MSFRTAPEWRKEIGVAELVEAARRAAERLRDAAEFHRTQTNLDPSPDLGSHADVMRSEHDGASGCLGGEGSTSALCGDDSERLDYEHAVGDLQDRIERDSQRGEDAYVRHQERTAELDEADRQAREAERDADLDVPLPTTSEKLKAAIERLRRHVALVADVQHAVAEACDSVMPRAEALKRELGCTRRVACFLAQAEVDLMLKQRLGMEGRRVDHSASLTDFHKAFELTVWAELSPRLDALLKEPAATRIDALRRMRDERRRHSDKDRPVRASLGWLARALEVVTALACGDWPIEEGAALREARRGGQAARSQGRSERGLDALVKKHFGGVKRTAWIASIVSHVPMFYRNGFVHADLAPSDVARRYLRLLVGDCQGIKFLVDANQSEPSDAMKRELREQSWFPKRDSELPEMLRLTRHERGLTDGTERSESADSWGFGVVGSGGVTWRARWKFPAGSFGAKWSEFDQGVLVDADSVLEYSSQGFKCVIELTRVGAWPFGHLDQDGACEIPM